MIRFDLAVPTFLVDDVGMTARWYRDELGFGVSTFPDREPYEWAGLSRDGIEIMLLRLEGYEKPDLAERRPAGLWDAYLRVTGLDALFERIRGRGFVRSEPKRLPYGLWEFTVRDPNGYLLVFSEASD